MKHFCIIDTENSHIADKLEKYGYHCVPTEKSSDVSDPISHHADVLYLKTEADSLMVSECQNNNISFLCSQGFSVKKVKLEPGYKHECKLNIAVGDSMIILNPKTALDEAYLPQDKEIIKVSQGYTKCSTIVLPDDNFITEDTGIYTALTKADKNCMLIQKGYVKLEGYSCGFIGGASAYLEKEKTLLFFGNIAEHPDFQRISDYCACLGIQIDYIPELQLTDLGGAVFLQSAV